MFFLFVDELIPQKFLDIVRERDLRASELLRHFWACFPITSDTQPQVQRFVDALSKQYSNLQVSCFALLTSACAVGTKMLTFSNVIVSHSSENGFIPITTADSCHYWTL